MSPSDDMMASFNLGSLPSDILLMISEYLDSETLRNWALVDEQSQVAARSTLFASITIRARNLSSDIEQWRSILHRHSAFKTIRQLRVDGSSGVPQKHNEAETLDFAPLEQFLAQLPALSQLTWACPQKFPEPLLRVLHETLPSCRLYLEAFQLRSVFDPTQEEYERRLLSSPNLSAISVPPERVPYRAAQRGQILRHVVRLAPNLRSLSQARSGDSLTVSEQPRARPPQTHPWLENLERQGRLDSLQCVGPLTSTALAEWTAATDWSRLRTLALGASWTEEGAAQVYEYLDTECKLSNLQSLDINIPTGGTPEQAIAETLAARSFLCNLRPLHTLRLSGNLDCGFLQPVLERHGDRLRTLDLSPVVGTLRTWHSSPKGLLNHVSANASDLFNILRPCARLEDIFVPIPRTCSNKEESAIYRAIGEALPRVQRIDILLDARDPTFFGDPELWDEQLIPTDPDFDEVDNEFLDDWATDQGLGPRKGHIRHAFINSAIDEALVQSIFRVIDSAKPEDPLALPLEEIHITTEPGGWVGDGVTSGGIRSACKIMGQSWIVRRNPRDDSRHEINAVTWPGDRAKRSGVSGSPKEEDVALEWDTIRVPFQKAFPSLQNDVTGPEGWQRAWYSQPLAT